MTISLEPDQISSGDQVTITIYGLPDDSHFSLDIKATVQVEPGGEFSFETGNFIMPYSLQNGELTATMQNTQQNVIHAKFNDTEVKKIGNSVDGYYTTSESGTISAGTYDFIRLGGIASGDADHVIATLILSGTKKGPDDSTISFNVFSTADSTIEVKVRVNGEELLNKVLILGNPSTTTPTTATPTPTYTYSGGGGGGGGGGYSAGFIATTTGTPTPEIPGTPAPSGTTPIQAMETTVTATAAGEEVTPAGAAGSIPVPTKAAFNIFIPVFAAILGFVYISSRKR